MCKIVISVLDLHNCNISQNPHAHDAYDTKVEFCKNSVEFVNLMQQINKNTSFCLVLQLVN